MDTLSDISSISWTEESFENQSYTNTNSSAIDNQTEKKIPIFNKRKKMIIFTIIGILILIIIIMIPIIISLLKSNNTINQISTSTNNLNDHTKPTSTTTATIYNVGDGGISGGPPCLSYTVINDPSRNIGKSGIGGACDDGPLFSTSIGGRWVRFMGIGGTLLPSISPGMQHCGAFLTGWSNITLPLTRDMLVNGTVCFEGITHKCLFKIPMTIVNCVSFYVYFLRPVYFCNARYCII